MSADARSLHVTNCPAPRRPPPAAFAASAAQIRKLFNLSKDDDVRSYVNTYRLEVESNGKKHSKAPKIQRLVTPETPQPKRWQTAVRKGRR